MSSESLSYNNKKLRSSKYSKHLKIKYETNYSVRSAPLYNNELGCVEIQKKYKI